MSDQESDPSSATDVSSRSTDDLWAVALGPRCGRDVARRTTGLRALSVSSVGEIAATYGLAPVKARRVSAVLELARRLVQEPLVRGEPIRTSAEVFRHFHAGMRDLRVERFYVVLLDGKHRFLSSTLVSQGTLTSSPVHPREVFSIAIRQSAAAVVLVHNHPSGDPTPSADDLAITRRLCEVGELVGIRVVDHVVVGDGSFVSLADRGILR
jgi:DNA repair protein RadC